MQFPPQNKLKITPFSERNRKIWVSHQIYLQIHSSLWFCSKKTPKCKLKITPFSERNRKILVHISRLFLGGNCIFSLLWREIHILSVVWGENHIFRLSEEEIKCLGCFESETAFSGSFEVGLRGKAHLQAA